YEGVLESLKNMLLVMSTQGVFQPANEDPTTKPHDKEITSHNLWDLTWLHLEPVLPGLKDDLFPPPPPPSPPVQEGGLEKGE
ncbi:hypothetical protein HK102_012190, partial [Quaeritorhiza haematococci]